VTERMKPKDYQKAAQKASGQQPETAILRAVRDYLRVQGWLCIRMQQGIGSHKGIADLYCLKDGRSVWLEIKTPTGKQSRHQEAFQDQVRNYGGEYAIARSLDDVMSW